MESLPLWTDIKQLWPHLAATLALVLAVSASAHLVMYKKDTRAAIGWIAVILMVPLLGPILYALLGINRLQRRALTLRGAAPPRPIVSPHCVADSAGIAKALSPQARHLAALDNLIAQLTKRPLLDGNRVSQLINGDQAYPEMLRAIEEAESTLTLSSYIFDNDRAGRIFADALTGAVRRGVEVRVMVDDIGARYSFPSIVHRLRRDRVTVARFLPTLVPARFAYANLRNHRKLLVADGRLGFTGGLNIREGHDSQFHSKYPIQDHHFRIEGPVVAHLQEVFAEDWAFCTGELLQDEKWFPKLEPVGKVLARGISAGPDGDLDKLRLTLEGALSCARSSVCIITPYFLPDAPLIAALNVAALRGVEVDIILPEANNLTLVKWASTALLWQVLERGCRVWLSPPPFDHSKLMLIDRAWTLLGSGNWDPRSLRLNFEFDVECYDCELAENLHCWASHKRQLARRVTLADVDGRSIPIRLRDGLARLLTPYL
ncbi:MAG: PLDc N-terminal domain-containing protein [Planctomycetia bacterium]|nr:PLDc N-terminal domain-containing protein [Planctomycetia bacterium]